MALILLTHSYFLKLDPKEHRAMMPYPPLGTLYAAAVLRQSGWETALFDAMLAESEQELIREIETHHPAIVVVYDDDFNYLTKMCLERMRQAAFTMSRIASEHGCKVIVHGSDAADHAGQYLANGADAVIVGEGEQTLTELVGHMLATGTPPSHIPGVSFLDGTMVVNTGKRPVLHELDRIPFPARDLVDVERYRSVWKERHGYFSMNIVTTRGCPFHCNWCAKPIYGQVYNTRSPENVVSEMLEIRERFNPDHLWFCDDIFGLKPGWVPAFSAEILRRNALIPFKCLSRVDLLLKEDTVRHLAASGCRTVWVGAESGSQKILDAMEKGTTVEQIYEATRQLHAAGIQVGFFLQYGYPGETVEDIEMTLRMLKDCMPDEIGISVSYPLPGTPFFQNVSATLGEQHNWVDSQDLALMFAGTYHPDFYRLLHRVTHKKFRLWQGAMLARSFIHHPWSLRRGTLRRLVAAGYHAVTLPGAEARLRTLRGLPVPGRAS